VDRWTWLVIPLLLACGSKTLLGGIDRPSDAAVDSAVDSRVDSAVDSAVDTAFDSSPFCRADMECDDGVFCNGREFCNMGGCVEGLPIDCTPPPDGCSDGFCDEGILGCLIVPIDNDADSHLPVECGGGDCDDDDETVFAGAPELCDYTDNDCDGEVDEGIAYVPLGASRDISEGIDGAIRPDVAFDGSNYDIVFDSEIGVGQVIHASVRRSGRIASSPVPVTFSMVLASSPSLTWTGSEYGLWHHFHLDEAFQGTISLTRLAADATVITRAIAVTPDVPDADVPGAAWDGSSWGVAYVTSSAAGGFEIRFLRATAEGVVTVRPVTLSTAFDIPFIRPSVAWTGTRFAVAWGEGSGAVLVGMNRRGSAEAWRQVHSARDQPQTALTWNDGELALVWTSTTRADGVQLARHTDSGAQRGVTIGLTPDNAVLTGVSTVWSGTELGVTYQRSRTAMPGTFIVRVGNEARWTSPPSLVDDRVGDRAGSTIATTGTEYGIALPATAPRGGAIFFTRAGCE
jgi:hypothetical protein